MSSEVDSIISKLVELKNELLKMDNKVRTFIADRKKHPHPNHEKLIEKIQKFENQVHRIRNSEVQMRLESLMYSLMIHQKIWSRLFEQGVKHPPVYEKTTTSPDSKKNQIQNNRLDPVLNKVYQMSEKIWAEHSIRPIETKDEMKNRILPEYQKISGNLKQDERVSFTYDRKTHKIKIKIKKK